MARQLRSSALCALSAVSATSALSLFFALCAVLFAGCAPKLVPACTYPLTAERCVATVVTDLAVIDVGRDGFALRELAPGVSIDDVRAVTAAPLAVASDVREMEL